MAQALKPLCLIQFWSWMNSLFSILALWGNKNWPPSMKVKKLKIFWHKMGSMDCKWSSLNAPSTQTPLSHPILKLWEFHISGHVGEVKYKNNFKKSTLGTWTYTKVRKNIFYHKMKKFYHNFSNTGQLVRSGLLWGEKWKSERWSGSPYGWRAYRVLRVRGYCG